MSDRGWISFSPSVVGSAMLPVSPALLRYDDRRSEADPVVEIEDVRIVHADAAVGDEAADRAGVVGAVNGVLPGAQRQGSGAHGILRRAARDQIGQIRLV